MMKDFRFLTVSISLLFIVAMASCKKGDLSSGGLKGPDGAAGSTGNVAFVSVVHAAPQTGSLQFAFNNNRVNIDIFNFTDRVNYLNAFSGQRRFAAFLKGSSDTLVAKNITLQQNKNYTVFITDVPGKTDAVLVRDSSRAPGADSVRIRFANMSPDLGSLDLYVGGSSTPSATNIAFKTAGDFVSFKAANNVTLEVRRSGSKDAFLQLKGINLVSGNYYTVWSTGLGSLPNSEAKSRLTIFWH